MCIFKVHVFEEVFFLLATVAMINEKKCLFPGAIVIIATEMNSFIVIMQLINSNYPLKNGIKK